MTSSSSAGPIQISKFPEPWSAESAHSMVSVKVKVFNDCGQTRNTAPDDFFFHDEFWYFAYFSMKVYFKGIH